MGARREGPGRTWGAWPTTARGSPTSTVPQVRTEPAEPRGPTIASLIVLYTAPDDVEGFLTYYRETHVPIAEQLPGLQRASVSRITGTPRGTEAAYFIKSELHFADTDALMAALSGDEGMQVSRDAMGMTQRFGCSAEIMLAEDL